MASQENITLMQVSCPDDLHIFIRRIKLDREAQGIKGADGKREKLQDVLIALAQIGKQAMEK